MTTLNKFCEGAAYGRFYPDRVVLEYKGEDALVMTRDHWGSRYVIAHGFDAKTGHWEHGRYFENLLDAATAFLGSEEPVDTPHAIGHSLRKYVDFDGEECRAGVVEDNSGKLSLFFVVNEEKVIFSKYHWFADVDIAAMKWVALLGGFKATRSVSSMALDDFNKLVTSGQCHIIADTKDVSTDNPLGLSFCGGFGAELFLTVITEDVPEYAEQYRKLVME